MKKIRIKKELYYGIGLGIGYKDYFTIILPFIIIKFYYK